MPAFKDLTGKIFGSLEVLRLDESTIGKRLKWYCLCTLCGNVSLKQGNNLQSGNSTTCCADKKRTGAEHPSWTGYGEIKGTYWGSITRDAKKRNLPMEVTISYCWELYLAQERRCALSGRPIAMHVKGHVYSEASLDRIDSSIGYVPGNVQWVHKRINRLKMDMSDIEFVSLCQDVYYHSKNKGII